MAELSSNQALELADQLMEAFRQQIELELLDGDETILLSVVGAKNGSQRASTDLMEYSERPKRVWRRGAGSVCMQWNSSSWKAGDRNTNLAGCINIQSRCLRMPARDKRYADPAR